MNNMLKILVPISMFLLIGCGNTDVAGPSSETGNAIIVGTLQDSQGNPSANTKIRLLSLDHNPILEDEAFGILKRGINLEVGNTITNSDGEFTIHPTDTGQFNLEAVNEVTGDLLLIKNIHIRRNDSISITDQQLQTSFNLVVNLPESINITNDDKLYISGTSISSQITSDDLINNQVIFNNLPTRVPLNVILFTPSDSSTIPLDSISGNPGEMKIIGDSNYVDVFINTLSPELVINQELFDFPLLLRLDQTHIDFNDINPKGENLFIANNDSVMMPHSIEKLDILNKTALIWVRVDNLRKDMNVKTLRIGWGPSHHYIPSSIKSPFDSAFNFTGVWHLENAGYDSSIFNNDIIPMGSPKDSAGLIGDGQYLNGSTDYYQVQDSAISGSIPSASASNLTGFTISGWIKPFELHVRQGLVTKQSEDSGPGGRGFGFNLTANNGLELEVYKSDSTGTNFHTDSNSFEVGSWYHVAGTYQYIGDSSSILKLFINGSLVAQNDSAVGPLSNNNMPLEIGRYYSSSSYIRNFHGLIDEFRISNIPRSEDWIKISYQNQIDNKNLISIK